MIYIVLGRARSC